MSRAQKNKDSFEGTFYFPERGVSRSNYSSSSEGPSSPTSFTRMRSFTESQSRNRRKNSIGNKVREKLFCSINGKSRLDLPKEYRSISEYDDNAAIPFSHLFIDEEDPSSSEFWFEMHQKRICSTSNSHSGSKRRGLKHSNTLPPLSDHQRKTFMQQIRNSRKSKQYKFSSQTIGRNHSRVFGAIEKEENRPNAVWEVLKTGTLYRSNPQDNLPAKSDFYFGDVDEEDETTESEDVCSKSDEQSLQNEFESNETLKENHFKAETTNKLGEMFKIWKLREMFHKFGTQSSTDSSNSDFDLERKRDSSSKRSKRNSQIQKKKRSATSYVALYNFDPVEKVDLRLRAGDCVRVTNDNNDSWWFGECGKKSGFFPSNFVMKLEEDEKPLICIKKTRLQTNSCKDKTVKKSQIVVTNYSTYKSEKADPVYIRSYNLNGFIQRESLASIEK